MGGNLDHRELHRIWQRHRPYLKIHDSNSILFMDQEDHDVKMQN